MKIFELDLEHHYKNKLVSRKRINSKRAFTVLGGAQNTDLRLLGNDVSPIHAYIEFDAGSWVLTDAGSQQGTWFQKQPITSKQITEQTTFNIGSHVIKLQPRIIENEIYSNARLAKYSPAGSHSYQQVIIMKGAFLFKTELLETNASYNFTQIDKIHILTPPKYGETKESRFGSYSVIQKIIQTTPIDLTLDYYTAGLKEPEFKTPLTVALSLILFIASLILFIPHKPNSELAEMQPSNKYNRMILDGSFMKKIKSEAKARQSSMMANQSAQKNPVAAPVKSQAAATKVVSKLKLSNLSALLGKIAKRADKNGPTVVGFGVTPDNKNAGHVTSLREVGSLQGVNSNQAGMDGKTFKVDAIGTAGKGGGNGREVAGFGGLAVGNAGSGSVGILEEETEIEGGLDKEVIAKVIGGYLGEVRYCYERQLSAEPDLYGKVAIKFVITADGSVVDNRVSSSSMKSSMVEGCILRRVARWKFPKPKGGTQVVVTYPFMFKATN
jgi:TonB family protein